MKVSKSEANRRLLGGIVCCDELEIAKPIVPPGYPVPPSPTYLYAHLLNSPTQEGDDAARSTAWILIAQFILFTQFLIAEIYFLGTQL